jgi:hypothetical protein
MFNEDRSRLFNFATLLQRKGLAVWELFESVGQTAFIVQLRWPPTEELEDCITITSVNEPLYDPNRMRLVKSSNRDNQSNIFYRVILLKQNKHRQPPIDAFCLQVLVAKIGRKFPVANTQMIGNLISFNIICGMLVLDCKLYRVIKSQVLDKPLQFLLLIRNGDFVKSLRTNNQKCVFTLNQFPSCFEDVIIAFMSFKRNQAKHVLVINHCDVCTVEPAH